ncbi:hypothetical protein QBC44DRAFT_315891 [Cladorrhinum sp. PSN332]|nr:hypothetical protein QBC44DRAFT_315891 [Cladorrhinum sp. PSN332]
MYTAEYIHIHTSIQVNGLAFCVTTLLLFAFFAVGGACEVGHLFTRSPIQIFFFVSHSHACTGKCSPFCCWLCCFFLSTLGRHHT